MTKKWLSFAMPFMYEFTMSMGTNVVDKYEYKDIESKINNKEFV